MVSPSPNFISITSIRQVELFGGAHVSVPGGIVNPWTAVGLAAEAAQLAPWEFDLEKGEFRLTDQARALLGFDLTCRIDMRKEGQ